MLSLSASRISLFKACRRAYELKYKYRLEAIESSEAIETGLAYHHLIEQLYETGTVPEGDYRKEVAMATAYKKWIYPHLDVYAVETPFDLPLVDDVRIVGRFDAVTADGEVVEHKTTSMEIGEGYEFWLSWNEQILMYMLATGARRMKYTVCRKPNIRMRRGESEEEFFDRMVRWYDDDTDQKIRFLTICRTDSEILEFERELKKMAEEIQNCDNFYRNPGNCQRWGRPCEYASACLHYDSAQEYVGLRKGDEG